LFPGTRVYGNEIVMIDVACVVRSQTNSFNCDCVFLVAVSTTM